MKDNHRRPTAFIIAPTNHGTMLVNRHDYGVGYQLLHFSSYDPDEVQIVLQLLQMRRSHYGDGVVALDGGANLGVHTLEWAKLMYGWGEVIAIEPQERIFYALAGNIAMNNCFNARAIWSALGAETGSIQVPIPNYFVPSSFGSLEIKQSEKNEFIGQNIDYTEDKTSKTPLISIDSLFLKRLDFIKIDIEGMEMEALKGAQSTLEEQKPELLIEKIKSDEEELKQFLMKLNYKTFPLGGNILAIHKSDPASHQIRV
jgi:methyltransferase, FkbM family